MEGDDGKYPDGGEQGGIHVQMHQEKQKPGSRRCEDHRTQQLALFQDIQEGPLRTIEPEEPAGQAARDHGHDRDLHESRSCDESRAESEPEKKTGHGAQGDGEHVKPNAKNSDPKLEIGNCGDAVGHRFPTRMPLTFYTCGHLGKESSERRFPAGIFPTRCHSLPTPRPYSKK